MWLDVATPLLRSRSNAAIGCASAASAIVTVGALIVVACLVNDINNLYYEIMGEMASFKVSDAMARAAVDDRRL